MPISTSDFVNTDPQTAVQFKIEPVFILFNSLMMLNKAEENGGHNNWLTETAVAMTPEQRQLNRVVTEGLHYAVSPRQSWPDFPAYIEHLAAIEPQTLRDRLFEGYNKMPCRNESASAFDLDAVMRSSDTFLSYLTDRFSPEIIDLETETAAYQLLQHPAQMQTIIVDHLRGMWTTWLQAEWARVQPMLTACVEAFRQMELSKNSPLETVELALGREAPAHWESLWKKLDQMDRIVLVPSPHVGPYMGVFKAPRGIWLLFGARLPTGSTVASPELSRSELLVRLNSLSDDARLHILRLLHEEGELCSRDVIERLNLSQSAASRHLKQLSAAGYVLERRRDSAKCYRLNEQRVEDTLRALKLFLLG